MTVAWGQPKEHLEMAYINEATLEMHFHSALMDLFRETYGLAPTGTIQFFKYSPQLERFVGFDQAYVRTELSEFELLQELRAAAVTNRYQLRKRICGYFLQFKVLKPMRRASRARPAGLTVPYFRSDLSTQRKKANHPSQHELLYSLAQNKGAMVYYACPMIFDRTDLHRPQANLDQLLLADVASSPGPLTDNGHHFLCFQSQNAGPVWCSEPKSGQGKSPKDFIEELVRQIKSIDALGANRELMMNFLDGKSFVSDWKDKDILPLIEDSLNVVIVTEKDSSASPK